MNIVDNIIRKFLVFNGASQHILCQSGMHNIQKGFGWDGYRRMDICLEHKCRWSRWVDDIQGNNQLKAELVSLNTRKQYMKLTFKEYVEITKKQNEIIRNQLY